MLAAAGFTSVTMDAVLTSSDALPGGAASFAAHLDASRYEILVAEGLLPPASLSALRRDLALLHSHPSTVLMLTNLLALGARPRTHGPPPPPSEAAGAARDPSRQGSPPCQLAADEAAAEGPWL